MCQPVWSLSRRVMFHFSFCWLLFWNLKLNEWPNDHPCKWMQFLWICDTLQCPVSYPLLSTPRIASAWIGGDHNSCAQKFKEPSCERHSFQRGSRRGARSCQWWWLCVPIGMIFGIFFKYNITDPILYFNKYCTLHCGLVILTYSLYVVCMYMWYTVNVTYYVLSCLINLFFLTNTCSCSFCQSIGSCLKRKVLTLTCQSLCLRVRH